jgi:hypothetical protein
MPIQDHFASYAPALTDPITGGFAITPHDANDLGTMPRAIMVTGAGAVTAILKDGMTITLPGLAPGALYPVRTARILATGTTATGIVGLY